MITTKIEISRSSGLWGGVSPETIKRYREELEALKKQLHDFSFLYEHNLFGAGELIKALATSIDEEVEYCLFYDEFRQRQNEPNFGQWVFRKQEDIDLDTPNWQKVTGDQWTKANGRVKAIIQFDRTGLMVKITLEYRNDSPHLKFIEESRYSAAKYPTVHLKSEASIQAKVQEFKNEAEAFLNEHLYPLYSQYEFELLKQLLCI